MIDLQVENLNLFKGERHLLKNVSLSVARGQCLQIQGPNGAGKTTLLRAIAGLTEVETLQLRWQGQAILPGAAEFQQAFAYLGHDAPLKGDLTAIENLRYWLGMRRKLAASLLTSALEEVGASAFAERPARVLSAGQRRRVALAFLRAAQVPLWLLDEPTTHLDSRGRERVASLLDTHLQEGGLALVVTHQPLGLRASTELLDHRLGEPE